MSPLTHHLLRLVDPRPETLQTLDQSKIWFPRIIFHRNIGRLKFWVQDKLWLDLEWTWSFSSNGFEEIIWILKIPVATDDILVEESAEKIGLTITSQSCCVRMMVKGLSSFVPRLEYFLHCFLKFWRQLATAFWQLPSRIALISSIPCGMVQDRRIQTIRSIRSRLK